MTHSMTPEEQVRALVAQGVPESRARQAVAKETYLEHAKGQLAAQAHTAAYVDTTGPRLDFPIRIVLPWSYLVSDNAKYVPALRGSKATLILTPQYREAKAKSEARAREAMGSFAPLALPLSMTVRVWVPDNRPHDIVNFSKALFDSMSKVVYADDKWLYRVLWERVAVDVDSPRAALEITAL